MNVEDKKIHEADHNLLIRIDERTKNMERCLAQLPDKYVSKSEFQPIKVFNYGMIAAICMTVLGALLAMVIR